ncbi:LppU/SCO3897 family protein [Streptomyces luteolus]|uniref:Uncharacterized protein n=1 Tax=Streptomyces luteolus TaxID=3043615 RepID=A0ABT6SY87_9ACTN|nr:hypothetical protein [Streptomyces sp. B-S-A12]MDI3420554.1 hypothetical protein [Streptomyces sp. B-S-A12]
MTTPPPQGQNPYGQPQGGNPYGGQAPQGYPQQQPSPYMQGGPAAPPPPASNRSKLATPKNIAMAVIVVAMMIVGGITSLNDAEAAEVGDCMSVEDEASTTDPGLEVVDCGDSKAKYKVADKKEGSAGGCDRTRYSEYTQTGKGEDFTLCLEDYTP